MLEIVLNWWSPSLLLNLASVFYVLKILSCTIWNLFLNVRSNFVVYLVSFWHLQPSIASHLTRSIFWGVRWSPVMGKPFKLSLYVWYLHHCNMQPFLIFSNTVRLYIHHNIYIYKSLVLWHIGLKDRMVHLIVHC